MNYKIWIIACVASGVMTACINDDSSLGGVAVPQLAITGAGATTMPVYNFNLGDECVIEPEVSYQGGNESDLQYTWSIGTYEGQIKGKLEEVSHDKTLRYNFPQGGVYYAHLDVTDGKVGQVVDYRIHINRTFEQGYALVSNDENGNGNLSFVKILTDEDKANGIKEIVMEHSLEKMNEEVEVKNLKNVILAQLSWPKTLTRVLASVEDKCYFLDPNTFTIISQQNYGDVYPGFKATAFYPDSNSPYAYDATMKKWVHLDLQYMFPYEYSYFKGKTVDEVYMSYYSSWGSVASKALFVDNSPSKLSDFMAYAKSYFPSTGTRLENEDILTAFMADAPDASYQTFIYALTSSKANPNTVYLHKMLEKYQEDAIVEYNSPVWKTTVTDHMAVPLKGTEMVVSPTYHRYYYSIGNKVYVFVPQENIAFSKKTDAAIAFPENEEVTCLSTNFSTEELYVATYNKDTKRGSFYIYNTADVRADSQGNVSPKESHQNCADKITSILYKPRVSE